ncbi:MAG: outer membrane beta-barrel protein [Prevotellaceae bacterium]|jgi:hypothetical protein|nr:outer membrane beta-barrel protein [Prevotellaceae bacterium]
MIFLKRIIFFGFIPLLGSASAAAAGKYYHEWGGSINMLSSSLAPVPSQDNRFGMGFGGGVGYSLHFNENMSIRTGLQGNYYRSTTGSSELSETSRVPYPEAWEWGAEDKAYDYFDFTSKVESYTAQQSAFYLQVPVLFEYAGALFPANDYLGWYASAGFKVGYAVMGSSDASLKKVTTSALLAEENVPIDAGAPIENYGWGIEIDNNITSVLNLGFSSVAYLEAGVTQQLTPRHVLYAGIFGEYSIHSVIGSVSPVMLEYEPLPNPERPYQLRYNPAANVSANSVKSNYFLSFGVTVRIGLTFNKRVTKRNERMFNVHYFQY